MLVIFFQINTTALPYHSSHFQVCCAVSSSLSHLPPTFPPGKLSTPPGQLLGVRVTPPRESFQDSVSDRSYSVTFSPGGFSPSPLPPPWWASGCPQCTSTAASAPGTPTSRAARCPISRRSIAPIQRSKGHHFLIAGHERCLRQCLCKQCVKASHGVSDFCGTLLVGIDPMCLRVSQGISLI